jgi:MFS family permease
VPSPLWVRPTGRHVALLFVSFMSDLREVVRETGFRRLFLTRLTAQVADGAFQFALATHVLFNPTSATSAGKIAAAFAVLILPYSLVGPFAGVFLDRWRRRQVLAYANFVRGAGMLLLAGLVALGEQGWPFYVTALALTSVNRFFLAGLSAALPHVVPRRDLVMANSVATTAGSVATLIGAGVGFAGHALAGKDSGATAGILAVTAAVYVASYLVARTMPVDSLGPDFDEDGPETREALGRVARGLADGARHVWQHRDAGHALVAISANRFCQGLGTVAALLLFRNYFHAPANANSGMSGLALAGAAVGAGLFAAALLTPEVTPHRLSTPAWLTLCLAAAPVIMLVFGMPFSQPLLVVGAFFIGMTAQSAKICVDTMVQSSIHDAYRGRVFCFYDVLFNVAFVASAALAALILPDDGHSRAGLGVVVAGYALTAAGYAWARRRGEVSVQSPPPARSTTA